MSKPKTLIVGNWKMNGLRKDLDQILNVADDIKNQPFDGQVVICPPATLAALAIDAVENNPLQIGGQDCHADEAGAFTGDISAEKWQDLGAKYVIVGHSERREYYRESDKSVNTKTKAVIRAGLIPVVCIGESLEERKANKTLEVLSEQIAACIPDEAINNTIVIGYEPIWAIGSGLTPTVKEIEQAHTLIRKELEKRIGEKAASTAIVYGGSMKPSNAKEILSIQNVDGGLVGGASLKSSDFLQIIRSA